MLRIRRVGAVVGALGLASLLVAAPASADTPEVFAGSATARALDLKVVNHVQPDLNAQATLGLATAEAASNLTAKATAVGELLADITKAKKEASADAADPDGEQGKECAQTVNPLPLFDLGIACGTASASVANNLPVARSEASVAGLKVDGEAALTTLKLDGVPGQLGDTLAGVLDRVCAGLNQAQACEATDTIKTVVTEVLRTRLLEVEVGPANSSVVTEAGTVTSSASSAAAVIRLLPLPDTAALVSTDPIVTIEVSSAKASVVYDRAEGAVTSATADPAIVRVKFNEAITAELKELGLPSEIVVDPGDLDEILPDTPLGVQITVADDKVESNADGVHKAVAQGVQIRLLTMVGESAAGKNDGGITLNLAYAEAVGGGKAAVLDPPPAPRDGEEAPRGELPRTGGPGPFLPMAGAGILALAALTRRATARAH